ncbi:MAG TPA: bifunctional UDP-N-acetylglucosamine diphosphorylase/glucosamine-1-phosphate N-acetyltransferase GlmU [Symbiobacteriaceae bacterium]|nr:bifunctional UDP-N-acetylglucosamine diphosphorylase/glucosamine-1-phosphate N-acetyltransferase GlmU [Symbiobacteriaceae bacterium]
MSDITVVVLAAGKGTRMKSKLIKIMHPIAGKPMIGHVVDSANRLGFHDIVTVVGYQQDRLREYLGDRVKYVVQEEQLGTGHAVLQAAPFIDVKAGGHVLVMFGDNPFLGPAVIQRLMQRHVESGAAATLLTAEVSNPFGLGRIVRDPATGRFLQIVEEKDASPEQKQIREIWPGMVVFRREGLTEVLKQIDNQNAQKEYYLPTAFSILRRQGKIVEVALEATEFEATGPNDRIAIAEAEARFRREILNRHMLGGVTIVDPRSTFIDEEVEIGQDTVIWPFTFLQGKTVIGADCKIGPGSTIVASRIADNVRVEQSVVEESYVGPGCRIGPMAHLRPGCELEGDVEVGNYAEMKKAKVARGVKCHHHSYLGDVEIGEKANIGAGVITANYNGIEKFKTEIGKQAFVGTNVNLIAPIKVGDGALVAAGSTINKDVPADALAVERAEPVVKEGRAAALREKYRARKAQQQQSK